jgi:hypothetical protein
MSPPATEATQPCIGPHLRSTCLCCAGVQTMTGTPDLHHAHKAITCPTVYLSTCWVGKGGVWGTARAPPFGRRANKVQKWQSWNSEPDVQTADCRVPVLKHVERTRALGWPQKIIQGHGSGGGGRGHHSLQVNHMVRGLCYWGGGRDLQMGGCSEKPPGHPDGIC